MGGTAHTYDANGNLTSDGASTYVYDIENRLVSASGATTATLRYDPLGRLYEVAGSNGTTRFLYDSDELVAEYNAAGTLLRRYIHGSRTDDPVALNEGAGIDAASLRFLKANHQGSIVAVTNSAATLYSRNSYNDYGIPGTANATVAQGGRFSYTGQIWLPEQKLYHYKARVYSPTLGRFLQTDPIGTDDGLNLYAYVGNDPVNKTDPAGMDAACSYTADACGMYTTDAVRIQKQIDAGRFMVDTIIMLATGGVGGTAGSMGARAAVTNSSNMTKGKIGELFARIGIATRGEKIIATQTSVKKITELADQVSGRALKSVPDFVVKTKNGLTKVVESKFATSGLTPAQAELKSQLGNAFQTVRTTADDVANVGGTAGTAVGVGVGAGLSPKSVGSSNKALNDPFHCRGTRVGNHGTGSIC